jgi:hypothetical protein
MEVDEELKDREDKSQFLCVLLLLTFLEDRLKGIDELAKG